MSDLMQHGRKPYGNKVYNTVSYILELEKTVSNHSLYFQKLPQSFQRAPSPQIFKKSGRKFTFFLWSSRLLRGLQVIKYVCGRLRIRCMSQASMEVVSFLCCLSAVGYCYFLLFKQIHLLERVVRFIFTVSTNTFTISKTCFLDKNKTYAVT